MANERIDVRLGLNAGDYVRGAAKAQKATDDITRSAKKQETGLGKLSKAYGGVAKAAAGAFAAREVFNFVKSSVKAFSDLEESLNAVSVGFGAGADTIKAFGEQAAETVGLSNSEFNQLSVTTGALMSNFITDQQDAADATIELTQRAADMASVFNTSVPDALGAVQSALRGEQEPIRRYGVLIDEAAVNAKALALGLAESATEISAQDKAVARLELIYEQTNQVAGDFAATSDGLANSQRILAAKFEDAKAVIGEQFAPALTTLLEVGVELLPLLTDLGEGIGVAVTAFQGLPGAMQAAALGVPALATAFTVISTHPVVAALAGVSAALIAIGGDAREQANDIEILSNSFRDLGKASPEAIGLTLGKIPEKDIALLQAMGIGLEDISDLLERGAFRSLTDEVGPSIGELVERYRELRDTTGVTGNIHDTADALVRLQAAFDEAARAGRENLGPEVYEIWAISVGDAGVAVDESADQMIEGLEGISDATEEHVPTIVDQFRDLKVDVAELLGDGVIPSDLNSLTLRELNTVAAAVGDGISAFSAAIDGAAPQVETSMETMFKNLRERAEQEAAFAGIVEQAKKFGPDVEKFIKDAGPGITTTINKEYGGDVRKALEDVTNNLSEISKLPGVAIVEGAVIGVTESEEKLIEGLTGTVRSVADLAKADAFEALQETGIAAADGLELGVDENLDLTFVANAAAVDFERSFVARMIAAGRAGAQAAVDAASGYVGGNPPTTPPTSPQPPVPPVPVEDRGFNPNTVVGGFDRPVSQSTTSSQSVVVNVESVGDSYDDVALALAMSGITGEVEWASTSTLRY